MRESKFRFWYKNNKTSELRHLEFTLEECMNGDPFEVFEEPHIGVWYMQEERDEFTGRRDKNGKEIYEGDLVRFAWWWFDGSERNTELSGAIVYSELLMSFQLKGVKNKEWETFTGFQNDTDYLTPFSELNYEEADFTVIGNIHENPELMNATNQD